MAKEDKEIKENEEIKKPATPVFKGVSKNRKVRILGYKPNGKCTNTSQELDESSDEFKQKKSAYEKLGLVVVVKEV